MILKGSLDDSFWSDLFQFDTELFKELIPENWKPPLHLWQDSIDLCISKTTQPAHNCFKSLQFILDGYALPWSLLGPKLGKLALLHRTGLVKVNLHDNAAEIKECPLLLCLLEWLAVDNYDLYLDIVKTQISTPSEAGLVLESKILINATPVEVTLSLLRISTHESRLKANYEAFFSKILPALTSPLFKQSAVLAWISSSANLAYYNIDAIAWLAFHHSKEYFRWFKDNLEISEHFTMVDVHWEVLSKQPSIWPDITTEMEAKAYRRTKARTHFNNASYPWKLFHSVLTEEQKHEFILAYLQNPSHASSSSAQQIVNSLIVFNPGNCVIDPQVPWDILELLLSKIKQPVQYSQFVTTILDGDKAQYTKLLAKDISEQISKASVSFISSIASYKRLHAKNLEAIMQRALELGIPKVLVQAAPYHKGMNVELMAEVVMLDADRFKTRHLSLDDIRLLHRMAKLADKPKALTVLENRLITYNKQKASPTI